MRFLSSATTLLLDILFPPVCLCCRADTASASLRLCADCRNKIVLFGAAFCPLCRGRLGTNRKACHPSAPFKLCCAASYEDPIVRTLIWQLKFEHRTSAASAGADLLLEHFARLQLRLQNPLLIPIPLHRRRLKERGYNQAALLARQVSSRLGIPVDETILLKPTQTKPQSELPNWEARRANIGQCFAVAHPERIYGRQLILVDDVFTSGATLVAAANLLKQYGARNLLALTIAKAG